MTCRTESSQVWVHEYNAENRISAVYKMDGTDCTSQGSATHTWLYTYDGDGVRVKEVYKIGETDQYTKYYFAGDAYEVEVDHLPEPDVPTIKRYYSISGMMVAMHDGTDLVYFAGDHLSSTSIVMDDEGDLVSQNRYKPFGEVRDNIASSPITQTDFGYTGQRNLGDLGLMDYDARFYNPTLMRFIQPDTIIVNLQKPQGFNRYSYVVNNPLYYIDPTGFKMYCADGICSPDPALGYRQDYLQMVTSQGGNNLLDGLLPGNMGGNQVGGGGGTPGSVDEDVSGGGASGGNGNGGSGNGNGGGGYM